MSINQALPIDFYTRPTLVVARDLLGKYLCREYVNDFVSKEVIEEVEAYDGPEDKACHAHKGRTKRTEVMFASGGVWYVYLCYGIHWMLNIVTGPTNYPAAVLLRGTREIKGPGRLTKKLQVTNFFNAKLSEKQTGLWVEESGLKIRENCIKKTPRIGVEYAGPIWSQKPYRYVLKEGVLRI